MFNYRWRAGVRTGHFFRLLQSVAIISFAVANPMSAVRILAQQPVSRSDLAGEWTGPIALDAGTQTLALVFRTSDTTVTGTVFSDGTKFGEMENPTLVGNKVHFKIDRLDFTGAIEGTTMKVALIVYNGSTRNLILKKVPALPPGPEGAAIALRTD